jgi:hypothetical protein
VATFILEHAYGKLTNGAVIDRVWRRFFQGFDREIAAGAVRRLADELDDEKILVFTLL